MEPSKNIIEAIGNLAMRYHQIELDVRDQADTQASAKHKLADLKWLLYANIFITAITLTIVIVK